MIGAVRAADMLFTACISVARMMGRCRRRGV